VVVAIAGATLKDNNNKTTKKKPDPNNFLLPRININPIIPAITDVTLFITIYSLIFKNGQTHSLQTS
jgi:hypothetical protein